MSKPHKHCELIKAWADGSTIQALSIDGITWIDIPNPTWVNATYRIKPITKLDVAIEALERIADTQRFSHIVSGEAQEALNKIRSME